MWDNEDVPRDALLYCYVYKDHIDRQSRTPIPKAFRNTPFEGGTDLSSDWNKYSTPQETRERLNLHVKPNGRTKNANDYFVVEFLVEDILNEVPNQEIEHDPIYNLPNVPDNRSHTKIIGEKDEEVRLKLSELCTWAIPPE